MNTIDKWEKLAQPERRKIPCPDGKKGCMVLHLSSDFFDSPEKKIIRELIDLVRKKDEALKQCRASTSVIGSMERENNNIHGIAWQMGGYCKALEETCDEALALTDQLK